MGGLGFTKHHHLNTVALAKLCWSAYNNKGWAAQIMREVYIDSKPNPTPFTKGSFIWKGLGKVWPIFQTSILWDVGDGSTISLWEDRWLINSHFREFLTGPINYNSSTLSLSAIKTCSKSQLECLISFQISDELFTLIRSAFHNSSHDSHFSSWSHKGKFDSYKAKLAIQDLYPTTAPVLNWNLIWQSQTHPKIKSFLWLLAWERIPHRKNLHQRVNHIPPNCIFCPSYDESCTHLFLDCTRAKEFWNLLPCPTTFPTNAGWHEWLSQNLKCRDMTSCLIPWNVMFCFAIWHIWLRKNAWYFSQSNTPISIAINQCIWAASEFYFSSKCNNESLKPFPSHWSPPPPNFLKINCDASFLNTTKESGCAVVCRDSLGAWVDGLVWRGYHASSHDAELKAIELALNLIKDRNWQNTIICSDAKRAIDEIMAHDCVTNVPSLLLKCRDLRMALHVDMRFERRQSNAVADVLARDARSNLDRYNEACTLTHPPVICSSVFDRDLTLCSDNSITKLSGDVPVNIACNQTNS